MYPVEKRDMATTGDIWRTVAVCETDSENGLNVRHWKVTFVTGDPNLDLAFSAMSQDLAALYAPCLADRADYHGLLYSRIRPLPANDQRGTRAGATAGTVEESILPTQTCGIATLKTGIAGRAYRGRIYIPFPPVTFSTPEGNPTGAYKTLINAVAQYYCTAHTYTVTGGSITLQGVLYHKVDSSVTFLNNWDARSYFATQRRRGIASGVDALLPVVV
jgi:hypothetical protein